MGCLDGKIAIITGGNSGIGKATAEAYVKEGAKVVITGRNEQTGNEVASSLGDNCLFVQQDVSKAEEWTKVFDETEKHFGTPNVLLNNAGVLVFDNAEDVTLEDWHKIMSIDLDGVMFGVKYGIKAMKKNGGSIINLCSIAGLIGIDNLYAYNAAKGAVRILTKSAALYCAKQDYGIRVNSVHPGYIHTPMVDAYPEMREKLEALHPVKRLGEASEVANMCVYLASDKSSFSTGSEFVVDGGYTAQ